MNLSFDIDVLVLNIRNLIKYSAMMIVIFWLNDTWYTSASCVVVSNIGEIASYYLTNVPIDIKFFTKEKENSTFYLTTNSNGIHSFIRRTNPYCIISYYVCIKKIWILLSSRKIGLDWMNNICAHIFVRYHFTNMIKNFFLLSL
jgi:hypothetical protein